jgi:hypothetical protein
LPPREPRLSHISLDGFGPKQLILRMEKLILFLSENKIKEQREARKKSKYEAP